jgi:hypothetical protein
MNLKMLGGAGSLLLVCASATRADSINCANPSGGVEAGICQLLSKQSAGTASAPSSVVTSTVPARSVPMYTAMTSGFAAYATPTDMTCLPGSATKTVYPVQLFAALHSTSASVFSFYFVKRSTADSGGTPTTPTVAQMDSANAAPTTAPVFYGSAPALGTSAGTTFYFEASGATLTAANTNSISNFSGGSQISSQGLFMALHGANEELCVNFNGAALPAGFTSSWTWQWIEQ